MDTTVEKQGQEEIFHPEQVADFLVKVFRVNANLAHGDAAKELLCQEGVREYVREMAPEIELPQAN